MCWGELLREPSLSARFWGTEKSQGVGNTEPGSTQGAGSVLPKGRQAVKCLKVPLPSLPDPSPAQGPSLFKSVL